LVDRERSPQLRRELEDLLRHLLANVFRSFSVRQMQEHHEARPSFDERPDAGGLVAPLDALVAEATDHLVAQRPASPTAQRRWAETLTVLEDQCQQASTRGLGALISRAWVAAPPAHRWG